MVAITAENPAEETGTMASAAALVMAIIRMPGAADTIAREERANRLLQYL